MEPAVRHLNDRERMIAFAALAVTFATLLEGLGGEGARWLTYVFATGGLMGAGIAIFIDAFTAVGSEASNASRMLSVETYKKFKSIERGLVRFYYQLAILGSLTTIMYILSERLAFGVVLALAIVVPAAVWLIWAAFAMWASQKPEQPEPPEA